MRTTRTKSMRNPRFEYQQFNDRLAVYVDGRKTGDICAIPISSGGGFAYYPNRDSKGGDQFMTIDKVKESIESE